MGMTALKQNEEMPKSPSNRSACWTPERRAAQSARMRAAKIWNLSTGPRTVAGKARSSRNALKTGAHAASSRLIRRALWEQARFRAHLFRTRALSRRRGDVSPAGHDRALAAWGDRVLAMLLQALSSMPPGGDDSCETALSGVVF